MPDAPRKSKFERRKSKEGSVCIDHKSKIESRKWKTGGQIILIARFFLGLREEEEPQSSKIKTVAAVGFLEEAFHFPGSRNQLVDFGYLAARE